MSDRTLNTVFTWNLSDSSTTRDIIQSGISFTIEPPSFSVNWVGAPNVQVGTIVNNGCSFDIK